MDKYSMANLVRQIENCNNKEQLQRLRDELVSSSPDDEETEGIKQNILRLRGWY